MTKLDDLMTKHARISFEIGQTEEYLASLKEHRDTIVAEVKAMVEKKPEVQLIFAEPQVTATVSAQESASALEETATVVAELGDNVTAARLATRLGLSQDAARLRLQRAEKKGLIRRIAFGCYAAKPQMGANGKMPTEEVL